MYCIPTAVFPLGADERKGHTADAVIVSKHSLEEHTFITSQTPEY